MVITKYNKQMVGCRKLQVKMQHEQNSLNKDCCYYEPGGLKYTAVGGKKGAVTKSNRQMILVLKSISRHYTWVSSVGTSLCLLPMAIIPSRAPDVLHVHLEQGLTA